MSEQKGSQGVQRIEPGETKLPRESEASLPEVSEMASLERPGDRPSIYEGLLFAGVVLIVLSLVMPWAKVGGKMLRGWQMSRNLPPLGRPLIVGAEKWLGPAGLFLLYAFFSLLLWRRTRRKFWGLVSSSFLTAGAIYLVLYFLLHWRWTLSEQLFGSWAMLIGLIFLGLAGIERFRQIEGPSFSCKALFLGGVLLFSGFFLPWMLKSNGLNLFLQLDKASWWPAERSKVWAYGIGLFSIWGLLAIIKGARGNRLGNAWSAFFLLIGALSLVYFFIFWRRFAGQFMVGLWGTVLGLVLLTFGALEDYARQKGFLGGLLLTLGCIILGVYLYALWTGESLSGLIQGLRALWALW